MKSLRADLASAARQARTEGTASGPTTAENDPGPSSHVNSNQALREADMVLNEFRQQLRADLRTQAYRATVPADTVSTLRTQLADVRARILASLD